MKGKRTFKTSLSCQNSLTNINYGLKAASKLTSKLPTKDQNLSTKLGHETKARHSSFDTLLTEEEMKLVNSACDVSSLFYNDSLISLGSPGLDTLSRVELLKSKRSSVTFNINDKGKNNEEEEDIFDDIISARDEADIFDEIEQESENRPSKLTRRSSMRMSKIFGVGETSTNDLKEQTWKYCHDHSGNILDKPLSQVHGKPYSRTNDKEQEEEDKNIPKGKKRLLNILNGSVPKEEKISVFSKLEKDQLDGSFCAQHFKQFLVDNDMIIPDMMNHSDNNF